MVRFLFGFTIGVMMLLLVWVTCTCWFLLVELFVGLVFVLGFSLAGSLEFAVFRFCWF